MNPTPEEAARLLDTADMLRGQVARGGARESRAFIGWGLFALVMLPEFDVVDGAIWGPVLTLAALAGWLITSRYYHERLGRVRLHARGRLGRVWLAWGIWYGGLVVMAELLHARVGFIWTIAAVCAALPLLLFGARLARQGR